MKAFTCHIQVFVLQDLLPLKVNVAKLIEIGFIVFLCTCNVYYIEYHVKFIEYHVKLSCSDVLI